jgi:hypothetical protein
MGQRFFEHTVPELVRQTGRLCEALEHLANAMRARSDPPTRMGPVPPVLCGPQMPRVVEALLGLADALGALWHDERSDTGRQP